jgi:ABC-type antimicrobial peptide transport system permease subunit
MIGLLTRSLRGRPTRTVLAVAGIGTSTLLVVVLGAAFRNVRTVMHGYAGQPAVDLWILPPGSDNLLRGYSVARIPLAYLDSVRAVSGVLRADPVLEAFLPVHTLRSPGAGRTTTLMALGYRTPDGLGGPPAFSAGGPPRRMREVALDRGAAFHLGVGVGDTILLGRVRLVITGLTRGTNILATQMLFGDFDAAALALGGRPDASLLLVQLDPRADRDRVTRELAARLPQLDVYPRDVFVRANDREALDGFLPLLTLIAALGIGAACVLVGLLVLSVVDERRSEVAVLLALGARPGPLALGVVAYAARLLGWGIALGLVLSWGLAFALDRLLPTIPLALSAQDALLVAVMFGAAGLGTAVLPVAQLRAIDPLEAFRP